MAKNSTKASFEDVIADYMEKQAEVMALLKKVQGKDDMPKTVAGRKASKTINVRKPKVSESVVEVMSSVVRKDDDGRPTAYLAVEKQGRQTFLKVASYTPRPKTSWYGEPEESWVKAGKGYYIAKKAVYIPLDDLSDVLDELGIEL